MTSLLFTNSRAPIPVRLFIGKVLFIMSMLILNERIFKKMMVVDKVHLNANERKDEVSKILYQIEEIVGVDLTNRPKLRRVMDDLIYKLTDRGFSFYTTQKMKENFSIGTTTIRDTIKLLKQSGLFFIAHRRQSIKDKHAKNGSNAGKGYVIFFKAHVNFSFFKELLGFADVEANQLKYHKEIVEMKNSGLEVITEERTVERIVEQTVENSENPIGTSVTDEKTAPTFITSSLLSSTHVININTRTRDIFQNLNQLSTDFRSLTNDESLNHKLQKIMQYMSYKILDRVNRGYDIDYISSFCEKFVSEQFALMINTKKEEEVKRKKESAHFDKITEPVVFYNWLDTSVSNLPAKRKLIPLPILKHVENLKNDYIDDFLDWEKTVVTAANRLGITCSESLEGVLEFIKLESLEVYSELEIGLWKHLSKNRLLDDQMPA